MKLCPLHQSSSERCCELSLDSKKSPKISDLTFHRKLGLIITLFLSHVIWTPASPVAAFSLQNAVEWASDLILRRWATSSLYYLEEHYASYSDRRALSMS